MLESNLRYLDYLSISQNTLSPETIKASIRYTSVKGYFLYISFKPSQGIIAFKCGGFNDATTIESPQDKKHHLSRCFHYSMTDSLPIQSLHNNLRFSFDHGDKTPFDLSLPRNATLTTT